MSTLEFEREVIQRLTRIETKAEVAADALREHTIQDAANFAELHAQIQEIQVDREVHKRISKRRGAVAGASATAVVLGAIEAIKTWFNA